MSVQSQFGASHEMREMMNAWTCWWGVFLFVKQVQDNKKTILEFSFFVERQRLMLFFIFVFVLFV